MTVKFLHVRGSDPFGELCNTGGVTVAYTLVGDKEISLAMAECNTADNFSYELGRRISEGRLRSRRTMPTILTREPNTAASARIIEWLEDHYLKVPILKDDKGRYIALLDDTLSDADEFDIAFEQDSSFEAQLASQVAP